MCVTIFVLRIKRDTGCLVFWGTPGIASFLLADFFCSVAASERPVVTATRWTTTVIANATETIGYGEGTHAAFFGAAITVQTVVDDTAIGQVWHWNMNGDGITSIQIETLTIRAGFGFGL